MEIDLSSYRLVRYLQFAIASVAFVGLVTRNVGVLINGSFALGVTFLPGVLKRDYRLSLSPTLTLWITVAVFLHAIGMLGLYDEVWWWDHLTHLLSATLVAGVGYATARAFDEHSDAVYPSSTDLRRRGGGAGRAVRHHPARRNRRDASNTTFEGKGLKSHSPVSWGERVQFVVRVFQTPISHQAYNFRSHRKSATDGISRRRRGVSPASSPTRSRRSAGFRR